MRFTKMNGAGNDFIILNNLKEHISWDRFPSIARTLCRRHLSIGADGLMIVESPLQGGDYRMLFYNSDGSQGEMCGNGARCICRYGYETGLAGKSQTVESPSGLVTGTRPAELPHPPHGSHCHRPGPACGCSGPLLALLLY